MLAVVIAYLAYVKKAVVQFSAGGGITAIEAFVPGDQRHVYALIVLAVGSALHYNLANAAKPGTAAATVDEDDYAPLGASADDIASVEPVPAVLDALANTPAKELVSTVEKAAEKAETQVEAKVEQVAGPEAAKAVESAAEKAVAEVEDKVEEKAGDKVEAAAPSAA